MAGIDRGDGDRVEVGTDDAGGWRCLLHLGNHLDPCRTAESAAEIASRRRIGQAGLQFPVREALARGGYLAALGGDDLVENGAHGESSRGRTPTIGYPNSC